MKPKMRSAALITLLQVAAIFFAFSICSAQVYQSEFGSTGTGNGQFGGPTGIALDAAGNIYVVDSGNNPACRSSTARGPTS